VPSGNSSSGPAGAQVFLVDDGFDSDVQSGFRRSVVAGVVDKNYIIDDLEWEPSGIFGFR